MGCLLCERREKPHPSRFFSYIMSVPDINWIYWTFQEKYNHPSNLVTHLLFLFSNPSNLSRRLNPSLSVRSHNLGICRSNLRSSTPPSPPASPHLHQLRHCAQLLMRVLPHEKWETLFLYVFCVPRPYLLNFSISGSPTISLSPCCHCFLLPLHHWFCPSDLPEPNNWFRPVRLPTKLCSVSSWEKMYITNRTNSIALDISCIYNVFRMYERCIQS